ncbi:alpha/beta fold hydrolase [Flavobacteriaceae bacterium R38]|nr:alpha/beta fold hydrolase [Flavobacteriaceae bacterium R38]
MNTKNLSLHHIIREPIQQTEKPAVIFLFHGYGSNEEDLFSFASELPESLFIISARAPHTLMPMGYAWYAIHFDEVNGKWSDDEQAKTSRDAISNFIDEAIDAYQLDASNVTLLGFSQGTILSLSVALSYPDKVKNVIAISGYLNEKILVDNYKENNYSNLHIYCSHGTVDQVIPVDWAQKTPGFLKDLGIDHVYEEFPAGHGVTPQNFFSLKDWLVKHL